MTAVASGWSSMSFLLIKRMTNLGRLSKYITKKRKAALKPSPPNKSPAERGSSPEGIPFTFLEKRRHNAIMKEEEDIQENEDVISKQVSSGYSFPFCLQ